MSKMSVIQVTLEAKRRTRVTTRTIVQTEWGLGWGLRARIVNFHTCLVISKLTET